MLASGASAGDVKIAQVATCAHDQVTATRPTFLVNASVLCLPSSQCMRGRLVGHHQWSLELHRKLLSDGRRNRAFQHAISKVARGAVVADIGAGTGFLSFLALQNHALKCHLYEADVEVP